MRNGNWGYSADRSQPNWTGRVPRQSRITGTWYESHRKTIPVWDVVAVALGALAILAAVML